MAFKPSSLNGHRVLTLDDYVTESIEMYRHLTLDEIVVSDQLKAAMAVLENWRGPAALPDTAPQLPA